MPQWWSTGGRTGARVTSASSAPSLGATRPKCARMCSIARGTPPAASKSPTRYSVPLAGKYHLRQNACSSSFVHFFTCTALTPSEPQVCCPPAPDRPPPSI